MRQNGPTQISSRGSIWSGNFLKTMKNLKFDYRTFENHDLRKTLALIITSPSPLTAIFDNILRTTSAEKYV